MSDKTDALAARLRKASTVIYLAVEASVADDISDMLKQAAEALATGAGAAPQGTNSDFCDGHCTWLDHHPACPRAIPRPVAPQGDDAHAAQKARIHALVEEIGRKAPQPAAVTGEGEDDDERDSMFTVGHAAFEARQTYPDASRPAADSEAVINAAERYVRTYDDDDRPQIKTDVLNAFYQGAHWQRNYTHPAAAAVPDGYTSFGEFRWACDCDERMKREWTPIYLATQLRNEQGGER